MLKLTSAGALLALLTGCNTVTEGVVRANATVQKSLFNAAGQVQDWTEDYAYNPNAAPAPQTGFCYKSLGDIVCYAEPQPNMSNPLQGYQGYTASAQAQANAINTPVNAVVVGGALRQQISQVRPARYTPTPAIDPQIFPLGQQPSPSYMAAPTQSAAPTYSNVAGSKIQMQDVAEAAPASTDPLALMPRN